MPGKPLWPRPSATGVVALSGGYRKTPLLQIGADVYADTALIARVQDGLGSGPTLYPAAAPLAPAMAWPWPLARDPVRPGTGHRRWRHAPCSVLPGLGFELGQRVSVAATDYGTDAVGGTLVGLTPQEVVIERSDARAGTLHVHFPRHGFHLTTRG